MQLSILLLSLSCLLAAPVDVASPTAGYIIKLKSNASQNRITVFASQSQHRSKNSIRYKYNPQIFNGIAGDFTPEFLADFQAKYADDIEYIEEDGIVTIFDKQENPPSWGLTRVSQRKLNLQKPFMYPSSAGEGVHAYIIDTGIDPKIADYGGRAVMAKSFITGEAEIDLHGHGSHVAGTVGGNLHGVAKKAKLYGVKVLNRSGSGTYSGVIAGISYVAEVKRNDTSKRVVSNMSLGGPKSQAVNDAIDAAVNAGVVMIVAAGNNGGDACQLSPAGAPNAFAVGASDNADKMASFSSRGKCLKLFGPGVGITSVWINGGTNTISGTSMASPHVCGTAALLMGDKEYASAKDVYADLISGSSKKRLTGLDADSPNLLVHVKRDDDDEPEDPSRE